MCNLGGLNSQPFCRIHTPKNSHPIILQKSKIVKSSSKKGLHMITLQKKVCTEAQTKNGTGLKFHVLGLFRKPIDSIRCKKREKTDRTEPISILISSFVDPYTFVTCERRRSIAPQPISLSRHCSLLGNVLSFFRLELVTIKMH